MALHGALRLIHACCGLAHTEAFQMHQYKSLSLIMTELRQRVSNAASEQWIPRFLTRGAGELARPHATPGLPQCTPTALAVGRVYDNTAEARRQHRLLPEP